MRDNRSIAAQLRLLALAPLFALLAGCSRDVLDPAGDIALQQRNLIYISTGLMLLIIVPVLVLIVVFAWRYRSRNRKATYDPNFDHSTSLELVIWSIPLLIIIALGAVTWSSTHLLDPFRPLNRIAAGKSVDPAAKILRVQVVAMDWKWLFIYPDESVATVNDLVVPVDRQVRFDITSTNMMNTFYAPTLAGMIYAMPGMQSTMHAVLNRPGDYEGYSANYSGAGFSDMRFRLRGVDAAGFDRWVAGVKAADKPLRTAAYLALETPSEKVPRAYFSSVERDLYDRILNRCVAPGAPCMHAVMAADRAKDGAGGQGMGMPPEHGARPHHPPSPMAPTEPAMPGASPRGDASRHPAPGSSPLDRVEG
jgi:cytochrome o ubiquinol oxidase subunit 2